MSDRLVDRTLAVILAGGAGSRLHPLTADRAKPAVPFGGKYRIVDFTLSNCHHSGLRRILVLTQYKSHSLQKHLRDGWSIYNPSLGEYVTPVPPQMRVGDDWYVGTADAVHQNLYLVERSDADFVVLLSGDHIYRMDYAEMLRTHADSGAGVTVACMHVPVGEASAFGVAATDASDRIVRFDEKPARPQPLPDDLNHALVSMGVYVFSKDVLVRSLREDHEQPDSTHDFGNDLIRELVDRGKACAYRFASDRGRVTRDAYWRDVGTIDSYFAANMDLLTPRPPLDLYQPNWPIMTTGSQGAPARTVASNDGERASVENVILCDGTVVRGGTVVRSILSRGVRIDPGAVVEDSILMDGVRVGPGARLRGCIVDKHARIAPGVEIGPESGLTRHGFDVSPEGVVVVPRGSRVGPNDAAEPVP